MGRRIRNCTIAISSALAIIAGTSALIAHQDDPKILDRQPRYEGPGYRANERGVAPEFDASGVTLMSWLPLPEFGAAVGSGNSCWGYVSPAGREYAIFGHQDGTAFVEVTDPGNAQIVGNIAGPESLWRDMKTYQNYCYSVSEGGGGIQVINMANIDNGVVNLTGSVTTGGTTATHTLFIDEVSGFLYRCGGSNGGGGDRGLRIYSLANPAVPVLVGEWHNRYIHECQVLTYTSGPFAGRQVAFICSGFGGGFTQTRLEVLDVTNKSNIVTMSEAYWPGARFSHQVWLSPDRQYAYLNDELDEGDTVSVTTTYVFNVSNLNAISYVGSFTNGNPAVGHNLYCKDNLIFESNYRSGLRVFDRTNPLAPTEVAYFDTYPGSDAANFNGLWNNWPFFPSGTIIGSDIERGLFVWRLGDPQLAFAYPNGQPALIDPSGDTLDISITPQGGGVYEPGSARLHYSTGGPYVDLTLAELGGNLFRASLPSLPCGVAVNYYASAETTDGTVWRDPATGASTPYQTRVGSSFNSILLHNMETASGWTAGTAGDDATTGIWTRVNPNGTAAQPEDDHSPAPGVNCWVTGQGTAGGGVGDADVDGGRTTLVSPVFNLAGQSNVYIGYWRWYSNSSGAAPGADVFTVQATSNNGTNWVNVEVVGPTGSETMGGWIFHEFRLDDLFAPTSQVRLRFMAEDEGSGSIIEAAVDDLEIRTLVCDDPPCQGDVNDDGNVDLSDLSLVLANFGGNGVGDLDGDNDVDLTDLSLLLAVFGQACP